MTKKIKHQDIKPVPIQHNFIAKYMNQINQNQVFTDRKKDAKRGYSKHKKGRYSYEDLPFLWAA